MQIKKLLYLFLLAVVLVPSESKAQNYADSTIVYLEWVSDPARSMVINWIENDTTGIAQIYYRVRNSGTPWNVATGTVIDIPDATVKRKSVRLTGLTPNTEYGFRIGLDSLSVQAHFFRTMPINLNNPVNFIVTGDVYGDGTDPAQETANFIESAGVASALDPYFMVMAGDLVHLNLANEYNANTLNRYFKMLSEYTKYMKTSGGHYIPLIVGLGNHELPQRFGGQPEDAVYFNALFSFPGLRGYNTLDFSDYLSLIMLNTDHTARIQGDQTDWLETQLSNRRGVTNVFPVYHVAAYPGKRPFVPGRGYEVRQYFSPLFDEYNVKFAFEHDNHGYKRTEPIRNEVPHPCGVRYIGEGGFAIPLGPVDTSYDYLEQQWNVRHIVNVELSQNTRRVQTFAATTGFLIDVHSQGTRLVAPNNLVANDINANSFVATWNPSCVGDRYRLDVSTDPNFATFISGYQNRDVGGATSVTLSGLQPLTTYYYRVRAVNSFNNQTSGNSKTLELTTSSLPPGVDPATNITSTSFTANWDAVQGADQYYIDVSTQSNFSTFVTGFNNRNAGNSTSLSITGLNSVSTYYYRVRAGSSLSSQMSDNSSTVGLNTLPEVPVLLDPSSIESTGFVLKWNPVLRVDQYILDISTDSTFTSFLTGYNSRAVGNTTEFEVTGVSPLTRYYFRIRARNSSLNVTSANSTRRSVITPSRPPVVTNATSVTTSGFIANWQTVQGANRYFIDVATDPEFTQFVNGYQNLDNGGSTSLSLNDLMSAMTYYYRVRASNSSSGLTSENSETIEVITFPDIPDALIASQVESRSFTANWSSVDRVEAYLLDVSTDSLFTTYIPDFRNRVVGLSLSALVDELSPNTVYFYRLRGALIESNVIGGYSNTVRVVTILDAPENAVAELVGDTEITFDWDASENADEYFIDLALDPQFNEPVNGFDNFSVGSVTTIKLEGLTPVESYYFRVRASGRDDSISSDFSSTLQVNTNPVSPVLNPASSIKAIGFTASWNEVDRVSHYELDVAFDEDFLTPYSNFDRQNVGNISEFTLTDVLPATTLYYRIRAINSTLQVSSEWSNVEMVTTIAIDPATSTVIASADQILADGSEFSEITVTVRDASSNPLESVSVQLEALSGDSEIEVIESVTGTNGVAIFRVTNRKAEYVTYRATAIETVLNSEHEIAFTPVSPEAGSATQILASSFVANWSPVNGASSYRVDVSSNASFSSYVEGFNDVEVVETTQLSVQGLFPGDEYFYRIRAVAPTGTSQNSNVISLVTIQADPILTGVQVPEVNILSDGLNKGVISVTVRGANGQPMFGVPVRLETSDTHSTIEIKSGLSDENGLAEFEVTSDFAGKVTYTVFAGRVEVNTKAEINFVPIPPVALFPSLLGAVEFTAAWGKVNGATHYLLDVSRDPDFENFVSPYNSLDVGDVNEYRVTGLLPGTTYYYRIRAATPTAISENSNTISVTTYQIDLVNSTAAPSARKILANGEQKVDVVVTLLNEDGDKLSDVLVQLIPDESLYTIEAVQEVTNEEGIATFRISSLVAGEGVFTVSAGGLELDSKVEVIFLFADGEIKLGYNFPNPFGSTTRIPVTIPERMNVTIDVYNSFGQRVAELESKEFLAGYYEIPFMPRGLSSGVYIVRMIADGKVLTQKMMYIK